VKSLHREFKSAVLDKEVPIEDALKVVTSNVAKVLKLNTKGRIVRGNDADLVILNKENLNIDTVLSRGEIMVYRGNAVVKGTFEKIR
jgi:beta-aspartyl-dipeptidase (metallo-type)